MYLDCCTNLATCVIDIIEYHQCINACYLCNVFPFVSPLSRFRPVKVYRILCEHTVDEVMMNVAERKLKLEKNVTLSDAGGEFTEDAAQLLREAFKV